MQYHKSRVKHNPPHTYGDCLQASIACVLDLDPVTHVPHFFHDGCDAKTAMERLQFFLQEHGTRAAFMMMDGAEPLAAVQEWMRITNPGIIYLLFGNTGEADHVVICQDDKIIHDVAWYPVGLHRSSSNGFWQIVVFVDGRTVA